MSIFYNFKTLPVPLNKVSHPLYKYHFIFKSGGDHLKNVSVKITFSRGSKVSNINVSESNVLTAEYHSNTSTLAFKKFKQNQIVSVHIFVQTESEEDFKLTSTPKGILTQSNDIVVDGHNSSGAAQQIPQPLRHDILVASALQEEMAPLIEGKHPDYVGTDPLMKTYRVSTLFGTVHHILCYSADKMGMPYNGVALTRIIEQIKPKFLLFIGTCAGFDKTKRLKKGAVLIPEYIYDYGSGKHLKKKFFAEYRPYDVSSGLIALAKDMIDQRSSRYKFNVEPSCGFCSGASVVDSRKLKKSIEKGAGRKVLGFDMEAYVIAVINHLYNSQTQSLVIKGIMDFGEKKTDKDKKRAKMNSAKVCDDLITHMINNRKV
jgi:nucleoside phosphorylase